MQTKIALILALALFVPLAAAPSQTPARTGSVVDFYSQIEPLFSGRCYGCHAEAYSESDLRLDNKASAQRVIQPGNSESSLLMHRVLGLNGLRRMPAAGPPLST